MPKIIDKEVKKLEIANAAITVFAKKGFANTKMADIAKAANIGKGTIYEYFKNKDEIFGHGFYLFMKEIETRIATNIFKITEPAEKLKAIFTAWIDLASGEARDITMIMLDFWAEAVRRKAEDKLKVINLEKIYADYRIVIKSILDEGIRLGKFRKVNTFLTASLLLGALDGIMLQWILDDTVFDIREAVDCLLDEFLIGICCKD